LGWWRGPISTVTIHAEGDGYLSEGLDADVARDYLNEIGKAEMQLRELESHEKKKS
jgi:hypothetical protein